MLCPLVYGYVNYAAPSADGRSLAFRDAPRQAEGGRPGSTLGGTGIGISRRCKISPALLDHLRWLMGADAQVRFIPAHDGQPSRREAWHDPDVNARWGNFYVNTAETLEHAYVRRATRVTLVSSGPSALLRGGLSQRTPHQSFSILADGLRPATAGGRRTIGPSMPDEILFSIEDQIATITLNRPQKLNAITPDMAAAIVWRTWSAAIATIGAVRDRDGSRGAVVLLPAPTRGTRSV